MGTWDLGTSSMRHQDVWGHEMSNTGTQGTWGRLLQQSEVNAISLSS